MRVQAPPGTWCSPPLHQRCSLGGGTARGRASNPFLLSSTLRGVAGAAAGAAAVPWCRGIAPQRRCRPQLFGPHTPARSHRGRLPGPGQTGYAGRTGIYELITGRRCSLTVDPQPGPTRANPREQRPRLRAHAACVTIGLRLLAAAPPWAEELLRVTRDWSITMRNRPRPRSAYRATDNAGRATSGCSRPTPAAQRWHAARARPVPDRQMHAGVSHGAQRHAYGHAGAQRDSDLAPADPPVDYPAGLGLTVGAALAALIERSETGRAVGASCWRSVRSEILSGCSPARGVSTASRRPLSDDLSCPRSLRGEKSGETGQGDEPVGRLPSEQVQRPAPEDPCRRCSTRPSWPQWRCWW